MRRRVRGRYAGRFRRRGAVRARTRARQAIRRAYTRVRSRRAAAYRAARGVGVYRRRYKNIGVRPSGFRRVVPYRVFRVMRHRNFYHEGAMQANQLEMGTAGMRQVTFKWNDMYDPDDRFAAGFGPHTPYLRKMMDIYEKYYVYSCHATFTFWQNTQSSGFANEPLYAFIGLCKDANGIPSNTPEEMGVRPHTYMKAFTSNALVNNKNGKLTIQMTFTRGSYRRMGWTVDQNTYDQQQWAGVGYASPATVGRFCVGVLNPSGINPSCVIRFNYSLRFRAGFFVPREENFALLRDEEDDRDPLSQNDVEYEPNDIETNDAAPPIHVP